MRFLGPPFHLVCVCLCVNVKHTDRWWWWLAVVVAVDFVSLPAAFSHITKHTQKIIEEEKKNKKLRIKSES
jgi:hypothetical protein